MCILLTVVCPCVLFPLAIVLSVLRYTDSDYLFGIFKLFFIPNIAYIVNTFILNSTLANTIAKYICIRQKVDVKLSWGVCVFIVIHLGNYGILSWLPPAPCLISLSCLALRMFFNLYVFVICSMYCISTEQHVVEEMLYELLSRIHSKYILPQFGLEMLTCHQIMLFVGTCIQWHQILFSALYFK